MKPERVQAQSLKAERVDILGLKADRVQTVADDCHFDRPPNRTETIPPLRLLSVRCNVRRRLATWSCQQPPNDPPSSNDDQALAA